MSKSDVVFLAAQIWAAATFAVNPQLRDYSKFFLMFFVGAAIYFAIN